MNKMDIDIGKKSIRRIQHNELQKCFSFWDFENNLEKRKRIECELENKIRTMYAYIHNNKYVAGMSLSYMDNKAIYLSYLVVNKKYRNQGIGTKMIRYACQISKKEGYSYIVLNVDNDNVEAQKLYKKIGFVVIGKSCERTEMEMVL